METFAMSNPLLRSAAAAVFAAVLLPAAGFAQSGDRADARWNQNNRAEACTQLEQAAGVPSDQCGTLSLSELAFLKSKRDNTN
jgi:hypothetical protein